MNDQIKSLENENALLRDKLTLAEAMFRTAPNFRQYKTEIEKITADHKRFDKKQERRNDAKNKI